MQLPLPYMWQVRTLKEKASKARLLQGTQLIHSMFNRFGKDISIGEAELLKVNLLRVSTEGAEDPAESKSRAVLFQDKFTPSDLHYHSIKRNKVLQASGPTLRRMEVIKKMQTLKKEWKVAQQNEEGQRDQLL